MTQRWATPLFWLSAVAVILSFPGFAGDQPNANLDEVPKGRPYSPYANRAYPDLVFLAMCMCSDFARVIEIPTPRWTAYDRARFGLELPANIPVKVQDRAYTSPIWYDPQ